MTSERIKEIQEQTAYPESRSVMLALKQVWNECEQEQDKKLYSEEEVIDIFFLGRDTLDKALITKDEALILIEQFKNK